MSKVLKPSLADKHICSCKAGSPTRWQSQLIAYKQQGNHALAKGGCGAFQELSWAGITQLLPTRLCKQASCLPGAGLLDHGAVLLQGYEPVMLVLAKDVPWFDERFRGPFGARTAHALDMSQHLTFEVNPNEFAMHMPFPRLEATRTAAEAIYDQV